jgi:uncharacterized damage-inducible protein DinB
MKKLAFFFIVITTTLVVSTAFQNKHNRTALHGQNTFKARHLLVWKEAIKQVLEVAEAMPEANYQFKPAPASKTFAEQIIHIGFSSSKIANIYLKGVKLDEEPPKGTAMSKAEIITYVEKKMGEATAIFETLTPTDLETEITTFAGNKMSKQMAVLFVQDHVTNHRAKANLYVRMNGITPPKYRYY